MFNFHSIPKICISLRRNEGRREVMREEFRKYKMDVPFFDAIDKRDLVVPELCTKLQMEPTIAPGVLACALSHIEVMRRASSLGLPAICIFEDDAMFATDFGDRIEYLQNISTPATPITPLSSPITPFRFDMFCLGGHYPTEKYWEPFIRKVQTPTGPVDIEDRAAFHTEWKHIYRVGHMGGTYAYIITRKVYEWVLRNWHYQYGMDQFYSDIVYSRFNVYAMTPFCVGHRDYASDITEGHINGYENTKWHFSNERLKFPTV